MRRNNAEKKKRKQEKRKIKIHSMAVQTVCVTKIKKRLKNLWETKSI